MLLLENNTSHNFRACGDDFLRTHNNSPRTLQHICKPPQANAQSEGLQKSCNFAPHQIIITTFEYKDFI